MAKRSKRKFATLETKPQSKLPRKAELDRRVGYYSKNPVFSFAHYDHHEKDFSVTCISKARVFHKLFEGLKRLSPLTWRQIETSGQFHAHGITNWTKTSRRNGFEKYKDVPEGFPPYQFGPFGKFRIVGFFDAEAVFHIVWFDSKHLLYP